MSFKPVLYRFKISILFAVTLLVVMAAASWAIDQVIRRHAEATMIRNAELSSVQEAMHMQSMLRDLAGRDDSGLTLDFLISPSGFRSNYPKLVEGMNVVKLNLFNLQGEAVWSTDVGTVGKNNHDSPLFQQAAAAGAASKLARDNTLTVWNGETITTDIVETYLPVLDTSDGEIIGVMEVYRDVAGDASMQIHAMNSVVRWTTVGSMGGLFLVLLGFIATADSLIHKRNRQLEYARDEAMEASRAKSQFLASMSHEIRTPMNAIIGVGDLLSETSLDEDQQRYMRIFQVEGRNLLNIINDILDISKIEAGQLQLETITFDLVDLVEDVATALAVRAHEKGLELNHQVSPEVSTWAAGDPTRLRQVLTNLTGNAIKFTDEGEVSLRVEKDVSLGKPNFLLFRISDTGIGINPEKLETIFEFFTQADSSTTRQFGGTGLGLTISRQLLEMMGGRIWAESEVGQGSTFFFSVPLEPQPQAQVAAGTAWDLLKGLRTMVVDDNGTNRLILQEILTSWGASVDLAESGPKALAALERAQKDNQPCQLLLVDARMPNMDGFQVVERIRNDIGALDITIMMLTSDNRQEDLSRCKELGITRYLTKPIRRAQLLDAITSALHHGEAAPAPPEVTLPINHQSGLKILLAEDHKNNQLIIQSYLKGTPHQLEIVESGVEAVDKFQSQPFDLVLMDMQMPVMDGYAAAKAIREWERKQGRQQTPIFALTANALIEDVERSLKAGCTAHLTKPIQKAALLKAVAETLP